MPDRDIKAAYDPRAVYHALHAVIEHVATLTPEDAQAMPMSLRREGAFKQPAMLRSLRRPLEELAEASLSRAITLEEFDDVLRREPELHVPSYLKAAVHDAIRNWRIGH